MRCPTSISVARGPFHQHTEPATATATAAPACVKVPRGNQIAMGEVGMVLLMGCQMARTGISAGRTTAIGPRQRELAIEMGATMSTQTLTTTAIAWTVDLNRVRRRTV